MGKPYYFDKQLTQEEIQGLGEDLLELKKKHIKN